MIGNNSTNLGFFTPMISWKRGLKYKLEYSDDSLPDSYQEYLIHDAGYIFRRAFTSIIEISLISIRYVGFLFLILPYATTRK